MKIKQGTKVKCVADRFVDEETNPFNKSELNLPKRGKVYTVREVVSTPYGVGLRLEELKNKEYYFEDIGEEQEPIFGANRFKILS